MCAAAMFLALTFQVTHNVSSSMVFISRPPLAAQAALAITTANDLRSTEFRGLNTWQSSLSYLYLHWTGYVLLP